MDLVGFLIKILSILVDKGLPAIIYTKNMTVKKILIY